MSFAIPSPGHQPTRPEGASAHCWHAGTDGVPEHVPWKQASPVVQLLPLLHAVPSALEEMVFSNTVTLFDPKFAVGV